MVPSGMTSHVHAFEDREGGTFRISLTYDAPTGTGKPTAHTGVAPVLVATSAERGSNDVALALDVGRRF